MKENGDRSFGGEAPQHDRGQQHDVDYWDALKYITMVFLGERRLPPAGSRGLGHREFDWDSGQTAEATRQQGAAALRA